MVHTAATVAATAIAATAATVAATAVAAATAIAAATATNVRQRRLRCSGNK